MSEVSMELSDDMLRQLGLYGKQPEGTSSMSTKFDDKGSLHIMCRDSDGKLLKDISMNQAVYHNTHIDYDTIKSDVEALHKQNQKVYRIFLALLIALAVSGVIAICFMRFIGG